MSAKPLSYAQRQFLQRLVSTAAMGFDGWGAHHSNGTGLALERRGLVTYEYDDRKSFSWGRWVITDAGKSVLEPKVQIAGSEGPK